MSTAHPRPSDQPAADHLAALADAATQREGARLAQDIFAEVFRQAFTPDPEQLGQTLRAAETRCVAWFLAGADDEARALRLALLIGGLDQWGLAYTQAFELTAMPALSALLGALRSRLNAQSEALFQRYFRQIEEVESDAVDFKVDLRRGIHLALWHAMAACDTAEDAQAILKSLGSMMLAVDQQMPALGWRLLADALAHIQVGLLGETASDLARESTQQLFASLRHALPAERYQAILAHSSQVLLAWQQMRRAREAVGAPSTSQ